MTKANILIVDDTPENVRLLMGILRERGYKVRPAADGPHALETAQIEPPDLILLDIMMPEMDGYQVCEQLKADARTCDIPVIFISAREEILNKVKAFGLGGVDYITKPFHVDEVLARVENHLTLRKLQQHLEELVTERTATLRQEIAEHQRTGEALRSSETQYRLLVEQVTDGIGIIQHERVVFANAALAGLFGIPCDRLIGRTPDELFQTVRGPRFSALKSDESLTTNQRSDESLTTNPVSSVLEFTVDRYGQEIWIEERHSLIRWEGQSAMLITMRDISERKRREQEIYAERQRLRRENVRLRSAMQDRYKFGEMIGKSHAMQKVYELIVQAAATEANVVIYGESGVGKDLVAQTIHQLSQRRKKAFIPVNCGSIQETLFEREFFGHHKGAFTGADKDQPGFFDAAHNGTLFLDEVGELTLAMQVKLLRAIEDKGYTPVGAQTVKHANVRIIAATNRNLKDMVREGAIRQDFFYRINVVFITVPPLRERKEDIPLLVESFLNQYGGSAKPPSLPGKILDLLATRDWPGNIRQLQNVLQRYLTLKRLDFDDDVIEVGDDMLSQTLAQGQLPLKDATEEFERRYILKLLEQNHGRKGRTAEILNIDTKTLYRKMKRYGIGSE